MLSLHIFHVYLTEENQNFLIWLGGSYKDLSVGLGLWAWVWEDGSDWVYSKWANEGATKYCLGMDHFSDRWWNVPCSGYRKHSVCRLEL